MTALVFPIYSLSFINVFTKNCFITMIILCKKSFKKLFLQIFIELFSKKKSTLSMFEYGYDRSIIELEIANKLEIINRYSEEINWIESPTINSIMNGFGIFKCCIKEKNNNECLKFWRKDRSLIICKIILPYNCPYDYINHLKRK